MWLPERGEKQFVNIVLTILVSFFVSVVASLIVCLVAIWGCVNAIEKYAA